MMKFFRTIFLVLLFFGATAFSFASGFFLEEPEKEWKAAAAFKPAWSFGLGGGAVYFLSAVDVDFHALVQYRAFEHHAFGIFTAGTAPKLSWEFGFDYKFYFKFSENSLSEEFLRTAASGVLFSKFSKTYLVPRLTIAYGKEIRFSETQPWAIRFSLGGSYLIGETIVRKTNEYSVRDAHTTLFIESTFLFSLF